MDARSVFIRFNVLSKQNYDVWIYLLNGEKSLAADKEIIFTELLLFGRMK